MARLEQLGLPYEIFNAVDGQAESDHPHLAKYDNDARLRWKIRPLSRGEIACFASHYSLWERCTQLAEPIVVLEDDVLLDDSLTEILQDAAKKIGELHYLRLGRFFKRKMLRIGSTRSGHRYVKYLKPAGGTQGYVIDSDAAKMLMLHAHSWIDPVDCYMDKEWVHGVPSIGIEPPCVVHALIEESDIGTRGIDSKSVPFPLKIKRETVRSYEKMRDTLFNLTFVIQTLMGKYRV